MPLSTSNIADIFSSRVASARTRLCTSALTAFVVASTPGTCAARVPPSSASKLCALSPASSSAGGGDRGSTSSTASKRTGSVLQKATSAPSVSVPTANAG